MDTVTQIALGAAVGELVLGKKVGRKAPLWGAAAGTLPDLDVLAAAFLSESAQLGVHRGISHSLLFATVGGPAFGYALAKLHHGASWREWGLLCFLGLLTHALLDGFTMYGTQLFSPFSDYPVALGSIFIIDPLYTLPLGFGLIAALCQRQLQWRRRLNALGLCLSTAYLLWTAATYLHARTVFTHALAAQNIKQQQLFTTPTPFNTVLWAGLALDGDHLWAGLYSLLDDESGVYFRRIERNSHLIADKLTEAPIEKLLWFSRGYYQIEEKNDALYFNDLRFGRSDSYLDSTGSYIFVFRLMQDSTDPRRVVGFQQQSTFATGEDGAIDRAFGLLWRRIKGEKSTGAPLETFLISATTDAD